MTTRVFIATVFLLGGFGLSSEASPPEQQPPSATVGSLPGPFVPEAGYLRTVQMLRLRRNAVKERGPVLAPGLNLALSGTRSLPVILVEFPNRRHQFDNAQYKQVLFDPPGPPPSPPKPTMTQYYRDVSNGQFAVTGQVMGWYQLPQEDRHYEMDNNGMNSRLKELLGHGLQKADAEVDFGLFDNDGPDGVPNSGDDDGIVDTVLFLHPERGGECRNTNIWSHSYHYSWWSGSTTSEPFVTKDVRKDEFGQPVLNPDGTTTKIKVDDYTIQPGLDCKLGSPQITRIGVVCHEYGHALGLPDLYDRTPESSANSAGIGNYCLMAGGSYGADGNRPETPVELSAWGKAVLGWATLQNITTNGILILEPVQMRNLIYNIDVPGTSGKEFFLIEFRDQKWGTRPGERSDKRLNWDRDLAEPGGVAIWHVDEQVGDRSASWPFTKPGEGQNDAPSLPDTPSCFTASAPHALVALIQADGQLHLEKKDNQGDSGDLFISGTAFLDDPQCRAGSRGYNGQPTGISLKNVNLANRQSLARIDDIPNNMLVATPQTGRAAAFTAPAPATTSVLSQARISGSVLEALTPRVKPNEAAIIKQLSVLQSKLAHLKVQEQPGTGQSRTQLRARADQPAIRGLTEQDKRDLSKLTVSQIQLGASPEMRSDLLKAAAEARTEEISAARPATSEVEQSVKQLLMLDIVDKKAFVRVSPERDRVEQITQLAVPTNERSPEEDARQRLSDELKPLLGPNIKVEAANTATVEKGASVVFQQVMTVGDHELPVSNKEVSFYYKDDTLTAIKADLLPTDKLHVSGKPGALTLEEAKQIVAGNLGVSLALIRNASERIHLVGGQPDQARVAIRLGVQSGGKRPDIQVLVDSETRQILDIQ